MVDLGIVEVVAVVDDQVWLALGAVATFAASLVWWILKELKSQRDTHVALEHEKVAAQHELSSELRNLCHTIVDSNKATNDRIDALITKVDENTTETRKLADAIKGDKSASYLQNAG